MLIALIIEIYVAIRSQYIRSLVASQKQREDEKAPLQPRVAMKTGMDTVASESATVRFIRSNTTILPTPHVIASDSAFGKTYIHAHAQGRWHSPRVRLARSRCIARQRANVVQQLRSFVTQMRTLSLALSRGHSVGAVCALNNAPFFDSRITSVAPIGPFPDERAFNDHLITVAEP